MGLFVCEIVVMMAYRINAVMAFVLLSLSIGVLMAFVHQFASLPKLNEYWSFDLLFPSEALELLEHNHNHNHNHNHAWVGKDNHSTHTGSDAALKFEGGIRSGDESESSKFAKGLIKFLMHMEKVNRNGSYTIGKNNVTLSSDSERTHIYVNGTLSISVPYNTETVVDNANFTPLVYGDHLPTSLASFDPRQYLEMPKQWKAPPRPSDELFIGIVSAGNHTVERMTLRNTWMQHKSIKSAEIPTRFFVAPMEGQDEVNLKVKEEADYFGDIVIVPYMDSHVLKTVAICEYGVRTINAKYIMKCNDDTFVNVDAVIKETRKVKPGQSLYMGDIASYVKPLRRGRLSVTYEEWPKEAYYPPYANGAGYIISSDIAQFILSGLETHNLGIFKMEDVSMGLWVQKFASLQPVKFLHSLKFCHLKCIKDYYTVHYQSPERIKCLWDKLNCGGKAKCCSTYSFPNTKINDYLEIKYSF